MAMVGRTKLSFHSRVLLTVLALCWTLVGTFIVFQYKREKEFKTDLFNAVLQMHNDRIICDMLSGEPVNEIIDRIGSPVEDLRITVVDRDGNVVYDNNDRTPFPTTNHNSRPEIRAAREKGVGHTVGRHSESDDVDYFYSATLAGDGMVVRSAVPYGHTLTELLRADRTFLWIMLIMTLVISFVGYMATRKISYSIVRLNRFAEKAERGERIFDDNAFPNDELGSIASHIVRLYVQRDERHREAMSQEKDKIRLKKQLTNNINHELKTPVASMLVCLDLLREFPNLSMEKKRIFFDRLCANAQRLNSLLKDVSVITRMDEGERMIEKGPVAVDRIVNDVVVEERLRTDMSIIADVPPLVVNGNSGLLESVFRNLIDNAISYSGGTEIRISADSEGNFTVRDNGTGVPEEHLPHIFERFYRVDKGRSRAMGGTGLGLSIVRNAVAIHGGTVRVSNDGGLRFDFTIPVADLTKT